MVDLDASEKRAVGLDSASNCVVDTQMGEQNAWVTMLHFSLRPMIHLRSSSSAMRKTGDLMRRDEGQWS